MIPKVVKLALLALAIASPIHAQAEGARDSLIRQAVFAEGRLWLLSAEGRLSSIAETSTTRDEEKLPNEVVGLCVLDHHVMAVTGYGEGGINWTLRQRRRVGWSVVGKIPVLGDRLIGVACAGSRVSLVTTRRLIDFSGQYQSVTALTEEANIIDAEITLHSTAENIYVGVNAGEFGGGLLRIERKSGHILPVDLGNGCRGIDPSCTPVTAVADMSSMPGCVIVAQGIAHMGATGGRLFGLCDDEEKPSYSRLIAPVISDLPRDQNGIPLNTIAFFSMARDGDALLAAGYDGFYRITSDKQVIKLTMQPTYRKIGGVFVSFDLPNEVLVQTTINQGLSVSDTVPMVIER